MKMVFFVYFLMSPGRGMDSPSSCLCGEVRGVFHLSPGQTVSLAGTAVPPVLSGGHLCRRRFGWEAPNWCGDIPWAGICKKKKTPTNNKITPAKPKKPISGGNYTQELGDDEFFTGTKGSYKGWCNYERQRPSCLPPTPCSQREHEGLLKLPPEPQAASRRLTARGGNST